MVIQTRRYTVDEFEEFIREPENEDRLFELINGEIIEVSPGRTIFSEVAHLIAFAVRLFCRERGLPCHTSGEAGAYRIDGHVVAPDFAYKTTPMSAEYPDPVPPLWAVEVISPSEKSFETRNKREIYLNAGILYWEVYLESRFVDVYAPGQPMKTLSIDGVLDGGDVLPGFKLPVKDIFDLD